MSVIKKQREQVAKVVGADLANQMQDDQLPAILNAIDGDAEEVRICAQRASRSNADNPAALMMWLLRERKHAGPVVHGGPRGPSNVPVASSPEEQVVQKQRMQDWKRIQRAISRSQEINDVYHSLADPLGPDPSHADAAIVRHTMISVLDEMEAHERPQQA